MSITTKAAWLFLGPLLVSCDVDLGPSITRQSDLSFGEIVYREACQRVTYSAELEERQTDPSRGLDVSGVKYLDFCEARYSRAPGGSCSPRGPAPADAPAVAAALLSECGGIVTAANDGAPRPIEQLDTYLRAMLPLEDDGTLRRVVTRSADLLDRMAKDPDAPLALSRLGWREGFLPRALVAGLPRALLSDPQLDAELGAVLPLLAPSAEGAGDAAAEPEIRALLGAFQFEIGNTAALADPRDPERTLQVALRLLHATHPDLRTAGGPYPSVLRDVRGVAQVALVQPPYVDRNHDGLADVDPSGRFVDANGQPLPEVAPFRPLDPALADPAAARDNQGRALVRAGAPEPLYRYQDLDASVLAALLRDGKALLDPEKNIPVGLLTGAGHLLGPRQKDSRQGGAGTLEFSGFGKDAGPLMDLLYGFIQLLGYSDVGDDSGADVRRLLQVMKTLVDQHEDALSRNLSAVARAFDEGKKPGYDAARLDESVTLYDDLAPIFVRLLRTPGLVRDIVLALEDPRSADLPEVVQTLMNDRSFVYMSQDELDHNRANGTVGAVNHPVRRDAADSDVAQPDLNQPDDPANNRSIMQRTLHLVHDANNLTFCNKKDSVVDLSIDLILFKIPFVFHYPDPCQLFQIDDLALLYLLSIISDDIRADQDHKTGIYDATAAQVVYFPNSLKDMGFLGFVFKVAGFLGAVDGALEKIVGIPGFNSYPGPEAAARLLFIKESNPKKAAFLRQTVDAGPCEPKRPGTLCCNQNHAWQENHDGVLFALEKVHPQGKPGVTFFTAFRPVVQAFAKHSECALQDKGGRCLKERSAAKILVDLLAVLHRHWPTKESRFFGKGYEAQNQHSGVVRYEPLIGKVLADPAIDLWGSTRMLAPVLSRLKIGGSGTDAGQDALPVVSNFLRWFFDPAAPRLGGKLRFRDGRDAALRNDGQPAFRRTDDPFIVDILPDSDKGQVTPYYVLADAFRKKRERLHEDAQVEKRWQAAVSDLSDLFLPAQYSGSWRFRNPRFRPVSLALLDFLRGRAAAHGRPGGANDLRSWVTSTLPADLQQSLTGPLFAATFDLGARLAENDAARRGLQRLLGRLADPEQPGFQAVVTGTSDLLQLFLDDTDLVPIVRSLAPAFAPDQGPLLSTLTLMRRGRALDRDQVLLRMGKNLYQPDPRTGLHPLFHAGQAVTEIDRARAGQPNVLGTPLDAADYRRILATTARFLADQDRGVTRFLNVIRTRKP